MNKTETLSQAERVHIANRWLEYEGELRAALIRVVLLVCFYSAELIHFLMLSERTPVDQTFHRHVTYLSAVWLFLSLAVLTSLARHWMPPVLKYIVVLGDVILLFCMALGGSGVTSSLMLVLPLLVLLSGLRGNLPLIWFTTIACLAAYYLLLVLGNLVGRPSPRPIDQMVAVLVIAATGVAVGQLVRMMRSVLIERLTTTTSAVASTPQVVAANAPPVARAGEVQA